MSILNTYFISCPYCLEQIEVIVDHSAGTQEYVEDCEVCCKPITMKIRIDGEKVLDIEAHRENE
ncbi:MAG: CPXCG motif-containing cysteine-rich protein [Gammaproteobacteria bacterium]